MSAPVYNTSLASFQILGTRARYSDTDYVAFSLKVGNGPTRTKTRSLGDLGDGATPALGLAFDGVPIGSKEAVVATYLIVNAGSVNPAQALSELENAGKQLVEGGVPAAAKAIAANQPDEGVWSAVGNVLGNIIGSETPVPILAPAVGAFFGWVFSKVANLINPNCDGLVAAEVLAFSGRTLWNMTGTGPHHKQTDQPGSDSAAGCGSNSHYLVNWSVEHSLRTTVSTLRDRSGNMHLFAVGEDGRVYTAFTEPGRGWQGWGPVSTGVFRQGTTATALLDHGGRMHLFAVGEDGRVYTTAANPGQAWPNWSAVLNGVFNQGTTVAALVETTGALRLFAVGKDGHVYQAVYGTTEVGPAWAGWSAVSRGVFTQGTTVSTLTDGAGTMHLFAVGEDGRVYTAFAAPGHGWEGWGPVSTGVFSQGTTVAALTDSGGTMHLFAVGENGRVYTSMARPGQAWSYWAGVSAGVFQQGTSVAAVFDKGFHLVAVGEDGRAYIASGEPDHWSGWSPVSTGVFSQGTTVSTLFDGGGGFHLFAVGEDGRVYNTRPKVSGSWTEWNGWGPVLNGVFAH